MIVGPEKWHQQVVGLIPGQVGAVLDHRCFSHLFEFRQAEPAAFKPNRDSIHQPSFFSLYPILTRDGVEFRV